MMRKSMLALAAGALLLPVLTACTSVKPRRSSTVPEEWVSEAEARFSKEWEESGNWVHRELFPCQFCFSFHGDVAEEGGPAHLVSDQRQAILCRQCQGVGREPCPVCHGRGVVICEGCEGFGKVDCPDCELVRVRDVVVSRPSHADRMVSVGCPSCDFEGGDCPDCEAHVPDLSWTRIPDRGEVRYTSRHPCRTCRSRGWLPCPSCDNGLRPCDACGGTGFKRTPCSLCGGAGILWPRHWTFEQERKRRRTVTR